MSVSTEPAPAPLPPLLTPGISATLASLRGRIRRYVLLQGTALAIACVGLVFWITLGVDWVPVQFGHDEPARWLRITMMLLGGAALGYVMVARLFQRLFVSLSDRSMAVLLERRFKQFGDSLITTVEMANQPDHAANFNPNMLAFTGQQAERQVTQTPLTVVFNHAPLVRNLVLASLLVVSIVSFALAAPGPFGIWVDRYLKLQDRPWPRQTLLLIEGDKLRKVARGEDVSLVVKADVRKHLPRSVRIEFRYDEGGRGRETLIKEGVPREVYQFYSYTFHDLTDSVTFDVVGGDYRLRGYRLQVVDSPTAALALYCEFPAYMVNEQTGTNTPREIPVTGAMQLPQGTKVTVIGVANKSLVSAEIEMPGPDGQLVRQPLLVSGPQKRDFRHTLASLDADTTILIWLVDTDGIRAREPVRLALTAVPDQIPQVEMSLRGIGLAVTPQVRIPVEGQITDDYGVERVWFEFAVDDNKPFEVPFQAQPGKRSELVYGHDNQEVLDLREFFRDLQRKAEAEMAQCTADRALAGLIAAGEPIRSPPPLQPQAGSLAYALPGLKPQIASFFALALQNEPQPPPAEGAQPPPQPAPADNPQPANKLGLVPGQRVTLAIRAQDACTLADGPHTGTSQRFVLEVVTPEKLRAILAARELNLRRRFEQIREEVTATRDSLLEIEFQPPAPAPNKAIGGSTSDHPSGGAVDAALAYQAPEGQAETGDEPGTAVTPARLRALASLRIQRAQQNSTKNANEVLGVALGFDDIREELENNRLYTEELESRLKDGIADPLKVVANEMFPELDRRLSKLDGLLANEATRDQALADAQQQAEAILVELDTILAKMLEYESFNKAIELIREILEAQRRLNEETKTLQKQKVLNP